MEGMQDKMRNILNYSIGLDIGTNSVGYAVTDENGNLLKFKGKNMWGVRLFNEGVSAKQTRINRCTRRRYDRRRERINLLQQMMSCDVLQADDAFFIRLSQSFLWNEDRDFCDIYTLFNDKDFDEVDYYNQFPTMYHLRKHLMVCDEKVDIRLVYLALHHIVKYRGIFLYEDQKNISAENSQIPVAVKKFLEAFSETYELDDIDGLSKKIATILMSPEIKKGDKVKEITSTFSSSKDEKSIFKNLANAMVGYKADFKLIFNIDSEEELKFALSAEDADTKLDDFLDSNQFIVYESLQKIYSAFILSEILKGDDVKCISDAMINKYEKHKTDLEILKRLFSEHYRSDYDFMFRGEKDKSKKSYTSYISGESYCTNEQLYSSIKKIIEKKSDELYNDADYQYCINEIENKSFLLKIRSKDNIAIPYQLHLEELEKIIDNQGKYYSNLHQNKSNISKLVSFRIPYYVGPLNEKKNPKNSRQFAWMVRKVENEKIYPWNFEDVVDVEASAENFITRMTNKCTYLPQEDVIPKCSLLYSEYEVLNEIKQIKVDNKFLSFEVKKDLFETLFKQNKSISENALKKWLVTEKKYPNDIKITGFQKEGKFATSLTSFIDFTKIFGKIDNSNIEMIENLILWITLFEDKKILKRKISNEYKQLTNDKVEKICKLKYSGWSRLSRKLLDEISITNKFGNKQTIIDTMRCTDKNFMQIITDDKLGFKMLIEKEAKPKSMDKINNEFIDDLAGSPAIKRGIKQSVAIVEEIVAIMKSDPSNIYIEFAREDGKKQRTNSRHSKIDKLYKDLAKDPEYKSIIREFKATDKKNFDDKMIYLYFIQNGKCMYSGKPLDITALSRTCQIDHIIPQSYIKDDSFDNLALVLSGMNQQKSDKMLIDPEIIRSQRAFWISLLKKNFISQKKYNNLTREQFDSKELRGFINRQLVETRQIIKHVSNLFGSVYPNTKIIEIKADLPSNLRNQYGLYKNRDINDFHHAHDAYIASAIGRYVNICFPFLKDEFDYSSYFKKLDLQNSDFYKNKNGIIIGNYKNNKIDKKTGELLWNGNYEIEKLHKCLNYKDCYISKKVEEQTGEFYDQTIYKKDNKEKSKLIPLKSNLPVNKYGGYSSLNEAYFVVVEYDKKKKREKKLVGIPIHIEKLQETKPNAIYDYLSLSGYPNPKILKDRIMKYQKIIYEGNSFYISSSTEVHNAKQLILPRSCNEIIYKMNNPRLVKDISDENLIELYKILCEKINENYPYFKNTLKKLQDAEPKFIEIKQSEKIGVINQILIMLRANPSNGTFAKYKLGNLKDREGRMGGKNLNVDKITFVNTSVTGLFENYCYGKDL